MSSPGRRAIFAVAAMLAVLLALLTFRAASGRRLAAYRAELRAAGEKLSLKELGETATGTSRLMDQLIARTAGMPPFGADPGGLQLRQYRAPGQACVSWKQPAPGFDWHGLGTNQPTWAEWENEFRTRADVLAAARELVEQAPSRTAPITAQSKRFMALRTGAHLLSGKAVCDLRAGELEVAATELKALAGMARVNRDEFSLVSQMIRVAIANLGLTATWEGLQAEGWTEAQLADLQRTWEQVELVGALEKGLLGDRAFVLDAWDDLRKKGVSAFTSSQSGGPNVQSAMEKTLFVPAYRITLANADELFFMKTSQQTLDAVRVMLTNGSWKTSERRLDEIMSQLNQAFTGSSGWRYPMSQMGTANSSRAAKRMVQVETERRLTITAIAIKRYRLAHGRYPPALQNLEPDFLGAPLPDPISAGPFGYRLNADGGFVLYSVGMDGIDDGGDATTVTARPELWEGKDAVWPREFVEDGSGADDMPEPQKRGEQN